MPRIHFLDVTNRDGVQTARTGLSKFGKTMVNFYLGRLGVAQSEIGFPFLFHEVPYVRAQMALGDAGAFGDLRLSGWCRAVAGRRGEGRCRSVWRTTTCPSRPATRCSGTSSAAASTSPRSSRR